MTIRVPRSGYLRTSAVNAQPAPKPVVVRDCKADTPRLVPGDPGPQWPDDARFCIHEPCGEYLTPAEQVCTWCGTDQAQLGRRRLDAAFTTGPVFYFHQLTGGTR